MPTAGVSNVPEAVATVKRSPATFPVKAALLASTVADVVPSCILLAAVMPLTLAMLARVMLVAAVWLAATTVGQCGAVDGDGRGSCDVVGVQGRRAGGADGLATHEACGDDGQSCSCCGVAVVDLVAGTGCRR